MTEEGPENIVDALVKRTGSFNGTGFQDWKLKLEMAVNAIQTGALHMLQISETSKKEVCVRDGAADLFEVLLHLGGKTSERGIRLGEERF